MTLTPHQKKLLREAQDFTALVTLLFAQRILAPAPAPRRDPKAAW